MNPFLNLKLPKSNTYILFKMKSYIVIYSKSNLHSININNHNEYKINDLSIFDSTNTIITFQTSDLLRIHNSETKLPHIIDLECLDKQFSQHGKELKSNSNWSIIECLNRNEILNSEIDILPDNIKFFLEKISSLYFHLIEKSPEEKERFDKIEIPVNAVIYERQKKGININFEKIQSTSLLIEQDIYKIKNDLQFEHNILDPNNENFQREYLATKNYSFINSLFYSFKIRKNQDVICGKIYKLLKLEQDYDCLLLMLANSGGRKKVYPTYLGFGTITSRIIVRQPSLQNLSKNLRDIIIPDKNHSLLYVDYSQFEAGILASLSKDNKLIELYNADIYADLANEVIGDRNERNEAKIIFYRFMYGDNTLSKKAKAYFEKFEKLRLFKSEILNRIDSEHRIHSPLGNFRISVSDESTWALSHKIQSTASYIYKNSIIAVNKEIKKAHFLLPMHDATLYQIDTKSYEEVKSKIESIYCREFKKICPLIKPRVQSKNVFA